MPQLETGITSEEEVMEIQRATGNGKSMKKAQAGMSLIETIVALGVLLIVAAGVMGLAVVAMSTTENQGHLAARTAEYAQDKMEQLLALDTCDGTPPGKGTDTTVFPAVSGGGMGLAGCNNATTPPTPLTGGSLSTTAPAAGYVDYLDASGNMLGGAGGAWQYIRVWQISVGPPGTTAMKQISVRVQVRTAVGQQVLVPQSTVTALKTWPF